jgi:hypothetical protein
MSPHALVIKTYKAETTEEALGPMKSEEREDGNKRQIYASAQ